jgi:hypothetical protein
MISNTNKKKLIGLNGLQELNKKEKKNGKKKNCKEKGKNKDKKNMVQSLLKKNKDKKLSKEINKTQMYKPNQSFKGKKLIKTKRKSMYVHS